MPFRFLLILLLLPFFGYSQTQQVLPTGQTYQLTYQKGGYGADSVIGIPIRDTTNTFPTFRYKGRLTLRPQDGKLYFHDGNAWQQVGAGGAVIDSAVWVTITRLNDSMSVIRDSIAALRADIGTGGAQDYEDVLLVNNISLNTPAIHRGSGNGLWFQNNAGTTIANVIWNESEQAVQVSTTNGTWLFRDDGSMVTYGIDDYDQNRSSQYTARTKTDKNYVDSAIVASSLDSNRFIKNDSVTKQTAGAILSAQLQARRGNFGDYDSTAMAPLKNNDRWPLTSKRYSKDVVGIESGLNVLTVYSFEAADQTASFYKSGAEFGTFVKGTNTKNFFNATHPIIRSQANNLIVQAGATGIIPECAVIYGTFANNGVGMTVQRSDLINVTYGGDSGSIEKAVGISISGINRGKNNTGLYLSYADNDPPQAGNWALYSDYFYPSYFKGRVAIGTFLSTIQHELYVNGDVEADSAFLDNIKISTVNNAILKTVGNNVTAAVAGTDYVIPSALSAYQQYSDTNTWDATRSFLAANYLKLSDSSAMLNDYVNWNDTFTRIATRFDLQTKIGYNDTSIYVRLGGQGLGGAMTIGAYNDGGFNINNGFQRRLTVVGNAQSGLVIWRQPSGTNTTGQVNREAFFALSDSTTSTGIRRMAFGIGNGVAERFPNPFIIWGTSAAGAAFPRMTTIIDSTQVQVQFKLVPMVSNLNGGIKGQQLYMENPTRTTTTDTTVRWNSTTKQLEVVAFPSGGGGLSASNFAFNETPTGTINGVNTAFTLAFTPASGKIQVWLNGLLQAPPNYSVVGTALTMGTAPLTGDELLVFYIH